MAATDGPGRSALLCFWAAMRKARLSHIAWSIRPPTVVSTHGVGSSRSSSRTTRTIRTWILGEVTGGGVETAALSRLFFLGLLDDDERPAVLRHITVRLEAQLAELVELGERIGAEEVAVHQRAALEYGIASSRFALDWFCDRLHREERR